MTGLPPTPSALVSRLPRRAVLSGAVSLGAALTAFGAAAPARARPRGGSAGPDVIDCETWGARSPRRDVTVLDSVPHKIIVHHTATKNVTDYSRARAVTLARAMQTYQMDTNGWIDTGQHFTVTRGGFVTEGRHESLAALESGSEMVEGAHCIGQNTVAVGIENEGTYLTEEPRAEQYEVLVSLCAKICVQYGIRAYQIYGHRDFNSTQCPGDRLYARLPQLREDVAAALGGDPAAPVWSVLRRGDAGERVRALQYLLVQRGAQVPVNGVFGPETEQAVRTFQRVSDTVVDGVAGHQTWHQLSVPVARGAAGQAVRAVQTRLAALGYRAEVDGLFGPGTAALVASFQSARSLPSDGVVDARTWNRLLA
ncbi:N-acetylmuramoyl-L-alanine amidase [Streptomyces bambusae]|uniref:peptidoglycan recognition protein family protein n=1 Tax=Streptomyces bambusae TaxID=1550616 RepID=UPI001CFF3181|nr:N-acetylmuramoyl-L-alanine amidase [Streptomyces bambusae]MCB5167716.1 N-acetylmuramoyl-L-alanine amidase [Streptomyces bambusae]